MRIETDNDMMMRELTYAETNEVAGGATTILQEVATANPGGTVSVSGTDVLFATRSANGLTGTAFSFVNKGVAFAGPVGSASFAVLSASQAP